MTDGNLFNPTGGSANESPSVKGMSDYGTHETQQVKIDELNQFSRGVDAVVRVVAKTETREVRSRSDMSTHRVAEALVGDETGTIYMTLWNEAIDGVEEGQTLSIHNGYINLFKGSMRLNIGRRGSFDVVDDEAIGEVNLENNLSSKEIKDYGYGRGRRYSGRRY